MAQDWNIKPRAENCEACEKDFEDRVRYHSALVFGDEGYRRGDYCDACWPPSLADGTLYSTWEGVFRLPPPKPQDPLQKETAESLLRKLMEDDDEEKTNVVYILAVMLERKRILVEKDVQVHDDGSMVRLYEHKKSGESFLIPDPRLRLDQLESVQEEVVGMLGGDRKPEEQAPDETPPADADAPAEKTAGLKDGFYTKDDLG
jgi:hypothetical protein